MFSAARWRLTLVFTGVLVVVLIACGVVVYLTTRSVMYDRVDHDLEDRARSDLALFQGGPHGEPDRGPPGSGSEFDPGGYFYAISDTDGQILKGSAYLDTQALASSTTLVKAMDNGDTFADTKSSKGEPQRIYAFAVTVNGTPGVVQIGRSTEPEEAALSQLRIVLSSEVSLNELIDEVARSMRSIAETRQMLLETRLIDDVSVNGDPGRLRELVSVLLDNAVKYADAGGRVEVALRREHRKAIIEVSDNGPGIPRDALPHVFDRFYRVDEARSRESGGTGLGLAIARHIGDAHGGPSKIESSAGAGTKVTVELPA